MADPFITATELAIFTAARKPQWIEQTGAKLAIPPTIGAGISMENAVFAQLDVELREDVARRTARVTNPVFQTVQTWTVTIDGNAVVYVGLAGDLTFASIITGLTAALVLVGAAAALVTFSPFDASGDGVIDTMVIRGIGTADYIVILTTTGAAIMDCSADAATANLDVWLLPKMSNPKVAGGPLPKTWKKSAVIGEVSRVSAPAALVSTNFSDYVRVAGYDKAYAQISSVVGVAGDSAGAGTFTTTVRVLFGPSLLE